MSVVTLINISKRFNGAPAVEDINLEITSGEFFSILGPSGCGKTTLLRIVAGFEQPDSGEVFIAGSAMNGVRTQQRGVGMVFQNYALFPHMTVFENVAYGLETKRLPKAEIRRRVEKMLVAVHLQGKANTLVPQLSGGEQQRVAVARALVVEPAVLLMDEPLSNLDVTLRVKMREEIRSLQRSVGITTIYVTHDQSEAMSLSDRLALLRNGKLEQLGTPSEMYERPASEFVAEFLGSANVLKGSLTVMDNRLQVGEFRVAIPQALLAGRGSGEATLVVKPEAVVLAPPGQKGEYAADLIHKEYLGFTTSFLVRCAGVPLRSTMISSAVTKQLLPSQRVGVSFDWSRCILL